MLVHNVRSRSKDVYDIISDDIGFTETQIIPSDSICKIMEILTFFNFDFNNKENKFSNLAYRCRNNVAILDEFDANGVCLVSFKKHAFADECLIFSDIGIFTSNIFLTAIWQPHDQPWAILEVTATLTQC